jgi:hypothetical protein
VAASLASLLFVGALLVLCVRLRRLQSRYARLSSQLASSHTLAAFDRSGADDDEEFAPWRIPNATDDKIAPTVASSSALSAATRTASVVRGGKTPAEEVPPRAASVEVRSSQATSMELAASIASTMATELRARQSSTQPATCEMEIDPEL